MTATISTSTAPPACATAEPFPWSNQTQASLDAAWWALSQAHDDLDAAQAAVQKARADLGETARQVTEFQHEVEDAAIQDAIFFLVHQSDLGRSEVTEADAHTAWARCWATILKASTIVNPQGATANALYALFWERFLHRAADRFQVEINTLRNWTRL